MFDECLQIATDSSKCPEDLQCFHCNLNANAKHKTTEITHLQHLIEPAEGRESCAEIGYGVRISESRKIAKAE